MKPDFAGVRVLSLDGYVPKDKTKTDTDACIEGVSVVSQNLKFSTKSRKDWAFRSLSVRSLILSLGRGLWTILGTSTLC